MNSRAPLPSSLNIDGFRVRDALTAGVAPNRLRAADLSAMFRGVRSAGDDRLAALQPLMSPDTAFSGPTAAKLWGLPLPLRWAGDQELHVSRLGNRRMRRPGVVSSRRTRGDVQMVRGLRVLDPVSTWISLGGLLRPDDLTGVADRIVTGTLTTRPLASVDELDAALVAAGSARWIRTLRTSRADVCWGVVPS
jgi:hypothetical protein